MARLDAARHARCRKATRTPAPIEEVLGIGLTVGLITLIFGWSVAVALYTFIQ